MAGILAWELANRIYRSRLAAKLLFGVSVSPLSPEDHYFDATSWVLLNRALREVETTAHVVDLGTGSQAIIGIALWKRSGCRVTAIEVNPELVASARSNAERNRAPVQVIESHFFDDLDADFDLVVFNPPYVPTRVGVAHELPESRRSQWDGGLDGLETVRGFLDALLERRHPLRCCLGVNSLHVDVATLESAIAERPGLLRESVYHHPLLPVSIHVCSKK